MPAYAGMTALYIERQALRRGRSQELHGGIAKSGGMALKWGRFRRMPSKGTPPHAPKGSPRSIPTMIACWTHEKRTKGAKLMTMKQRLCLSVAAVGGFALAA